MFCIARKLQRIYKEFRGWRKYSFANISKEKKTTWKRFESLQNYLAQGTASSKHQQEERECQDRWKTLLNHEETFRKKSSWVLWLEEGDQNMTFLNISMSMREKVSTINFLVDNNGQDIMEVEELEDWTNSYFWVI